MSNQGGSPPERGLEARVERLEETTQELQVSAAVAATSIANISDNIQRIRRENKEGFDGMRETLHGFREDEKDRKLIEAKELLAKKEEDEKRRTRIGGYVVAVLVALMGALAGLYTAWRATSP